MDINQSIVDEKYRNASRSLLEAGSSTMNLSISPRDHS